DGGIIEFDGTPWDDSNISLHLPVTARKVGYLFQNLALFPNMNVYENIAFGVKGKQKKKKEQAEIQQQVRKMSDYLQ
ncbi:ABC transporter ATP-binding protein, partial [Listeria monocytogenes]|nr:ABC transporter ATP-binding protein [Listeria monocytogenes]